MRQEVRLKRRQYSISYSSFVMQTAVLLQVSAQLPDFTASVIFTTRHGLSSLPQYSVTILSRVQVEKEHVLNKTAGARHCVSLPCT